MAPDFCCCNVHIKLQEYLYPLPVYMCIHSLAQKYFFYKHRIQFFIVGVAEKSTLVPFVSHIPDFSYYCQNQWYYKTVFALLLKLCEPNIIKQHKVCLICLYNETWSKKKERLFLFLTKIRNEYIFANVTSFLAYDDTKSIKVWKKSLNKKKSWWHHVSLWFEQAFVWCFIIFKT